LKIIKMKNNKRGISAIVATVLIILITVAAVTIVWAAIIPLVSNQLDKGTICLDAVSQVTIEDRGYTCYNNDTGVVELQIGHGPKDFVLAGVQVLISKAGDTTSITLNETDGLPGVNAEKVLNVSYPAAADIPESVSIAPIVKVGNTQETCDISSTLVLRAC
jgi:flagellin-like protein